MSWGLLLTLDSAWTALEAEGFGASLQHLHFAPDVVAYMRTSFV